MSAIDLELNGQKFRITKMDALKQFHVVRKMGPLFGELVPAMGKISKVQANTEGERFKEFAEVAKPFMDGLSNLSDDDANFILFRLLNCVEAHQAQHNSWMRVATESGIAMQTLELPLLLQLAGRAFMHNLSGFFNSLPRKA